MEKQYIEVPTTEDGRKPIVAIKIFYELEAAAEKEILKEFFRYVGCLVMDTPMAAGNKKRNLEFPQKEQIVFLFLTDKPLLEIQNAVTGTEKVVESTEESELWATFSMRGENFKENSGQLLLKMLKKNEEKKIGKENIARLIDCLWKDDEINKQDLQNVNNAFWDNNLFPYLQIKRTFRVVNMGEVLALGTRHYDIPDDNFIKNMAETFKTVAVECKGNKISTGVYATYAYVNSCRKIREIYNSLALNSANRMIVSQKMESVPNLLQELNRIYQIFPSYVAMYYLAAYLCQGDSRYTLDAYKYFLDARQYVNNETNELSAFGIYQLGRYEKKVLNKSETAFEHYKKAASINSRCYQAVFQVACYYASENKHDLAKKEFERVIEIISEGLELKEIPYDDEEIVKQSDWAKLSLKETQYIFKAYIWLAKLALIKYGESAIGIYANKALFAAIAYMISPMLEKCCDATFYSTVKAYHKKGITVRALFFVLRDMVGDSPANEDLKKAIDEIIAKL